jgi:hypothetical protein
MSQLSGAFRAFSGFLPPVTILIVCSSCVEAQQSRASERTDCGDTFVATFSDILGANSKTPRGPEPDSRASAPATATMGP